jgi:hypothetical protein
LDAEIRIKELETEAARLDAETRNYQAKHPSAPATPAPVTNHNRKRARAPESDRPDHLDPDDAGNQSRWLKEAREVWNGMVALSPRVWDARPPADHRSLPEVFAAVRADIKTLLLSSDKWRVRVLPKSPEVAAVYVGSACDVADCVRRFWSASPETAPEQSTSTAARSVPAQTPMAPETAAPASKRARTPQPPSLLAAVTAGLPDGAAAATVFIKHYAESKSMEPWSGVFFRRVTRPGQRAVSDVLGPVYCGDDAAALAAHPMVAPIRAWLARAVTDAAVRGAPPPFLADPDPRLPPPAIDGCGPLPPDCSALWTQLTRNTPTAAYMARYRDLFLLRQKSGPVGADDENDPVPAYVEAVHPERVRHLAAVIERGGGWLQFGELADALGWQTVRADHAVIVMLAHAAMHRDRTKVSAKWWNRTCKPHAFFVGAGEAEEDGSAVSALGTLRLAAAVVARLNRNGIRSETKTDLIFNLRMVTNAMG